MSDIKTLESVNAQKYVLTLAERLERHFDLYYGETREGEFFELYAFYRQNFRKSFITCSTVHESFSIFRPMRRT